MIGNAVDELANCCCGERQCPDAAVAKDEGVFAKDEGEVDDPVWVPEEGPHALATWAGFPLP